LLLRRVQGTIGTLDESFGGFVPIPLSQPDRARHALRHHGSQPVDDCPRGRNRTCEQETEFLATVPRKYVGWPQYPLPCTGGLLEDPIALLMSSLVVDSLEVVEVEHGYTQRQTVSVRSRQFASQHVVPSATIQYPGKRISFDCAFKEFKDAMYSLDALPIVRDVAEHMSEPAHLISIVIESHQYAVSPDATSVFANDQAGFDVAPG
jgi:hypothetical protein